MSSVFTRWIFYLDADRLDHRIHVYCITKNKSSTLQDGTSRPYLPHNHKYELSTQFQNTTHIILQNRNKSKKPSARYFLQSNKVQVPAKNILTLKFLPIVGGYLYIQRLQEKKKKGIHVYRHRRHNRFIKKQQQKTKSHFFHSLHIKSSPLRSSSRLQSQICRELPFPKRHICRTRRPAIAFSFSALQRERAISINI